MVSKFLTGQKSDKLGIALCKFCYDCVVDFKAGSYKCSLSQYWYDQGKVPFALKTYIGLNSLKFSKVVSIGLKIGLQMVFISPKKWSSFGLQWRLQMVFKLVTISGKTQPPIPLLYTQVQDMVQESLGVLCYPFVELLELISLGWAA